MTTLLPAGLPLPRLSRLLTCTTELSGRLLWQTAGTSGLPSHIGSPQDVRSQRKRGRAWPTAAYAPLRVGPEQLQSSSTYLPCVCQLRLDPRLFVRIWPASAVRSVQKSLAWSNVDSNGEWDICWLDTSISVERVMKLRKFQVLKDPLGPLCAPLVVLPDGFM